MSPEQIKGPLRSLIETIRPQGGCFYAEVLGEAIAAVERLEQCEAELAAEKRRNHALRRALCLIRENAEEGYVVADAREALEADDAANPQ